MRPGAEVAVVTLKLHQTQARFMYRNGYRGCGKTWSRFMHMIEMHERRISRPDEIDLWRVKINRDGVYAILRKKFPERLKFGPRCVDESMVHIKPRKD